MALPHQTTGRPMDIAPLGDKLVGTKTQALLKSEQLELVRVVLRAGQHLPEHHVDGEITFACIEGMFEFTSSAGNHRIGPGQLIHLARDEPHAVHAVEDASALLTICLPKR